MIEPATFTATYGPIKDFLSWLQGRADRRNEKVDKALRSLQTAILETKAYEEKYLSNKKINREEEFRLSRLWSEAAIEVREANNDLALRANEKARYWSDAIRWDPDTIIAKRIKLVDMEDDVARLLAL